MPAPDGRALGRLVDLTVRLDPSWAAPVVHRATVSPGRHARPIVVSWPDLEPTGEAELAANELQLGRDVLDTQVVDLAGRRLARVGEVLLAEDPETGTWRAAAVDVGFGAVCRRLGLAPAARRLDDAVVAWPDLHLASARGHRVQLAGDPAAVHRLDDDALAHVLSRVTAEQGADLLAVLPEHRAHHLRHTLGLPRPHRRRFGRHDRDQRP